MTNGQAGKGDFHQENNESLEICFDETYTKDLHGSVKFGNLSESILYELFRDGRTASRFLERHICVWFPNLKFVDERGHDFIGNDGRKFEMKCFTARGLNYSASKYQGIGRSLDVAEHRATAIQNIYILCDIIDFPNVSVRFIRGEELIGLYPNPKVSYNERHNLFGRLPRRDQKTR